MIIIDATLLRTEALSSTQLAGAMITVLGGASLEVWRRKKGKTNGQKHKWGGFVFFVFCRLFLGFSEVSRIVF